MKTLISSKEPLDFSKYVGKEVLILTYNCFYITKLVEHTLNYLIIKENPILPKKDIIWIDFVPKDKNILAPQELSIIKGIKHMLKEIKNV